MDKSWKSTHYRNRYIELSGMLLLTCKLKEWGGKKLNTKENQTGQNQEHSYPNEKIVKCLRSYNQNTGF